ncbi:hypothetical protein Tcan_06108 [Toxocara canis]|uniref:Uncharacterized protein n=1 Tax=Toxocara canis TaxID=6265 RepID=A0A0B2V994_TOXCA|nr:hypothetical protein Tcan_06108 [Toxocara canis]
MVQSNDKPPADPIRHLPKLLGTVKNSPCFQPQTPPNHAALHSRSMVKEVVGGTCGEIRVARMWNKLADVVVSAHQVSAFTNRLKHSSMGKINESGVQLIHTLFIFVIA